MEGGSISRRVSIELGVAHRPGWVMSHRKEACLLPVPPEITPQLVAEIEAEIAAGELEHVQRLLLWSKNQWLCDLLRKCLVGLSCEDCKYPPGFVDGRGCPNKACPKAEDPDSPWQDRQSLRP